VIRKYQNFRPFSEAEAWALFRLAAVGEAVGWTILITGIILSRFLHNNLPILIAGQFHGILFLIYFAVTAVVSPSNRWSFQKIILATLCGVPPYGSLAFEFWQSHQRSADKLKVSIRREYLNQLASGA